MKRFHLHVVVKRLPDAIRFYSDLFDTPPCCGGRSYANWRVDQPPLNLTASVTHRPTGLAHFGLEVESPPELATIDQLLHGPMRASGIVPWEVFVKKQPIREESKS
jgi:hypothetical protein